MNTHPTQLAPILALLALACSSGGGGGGDSADDAADSHDMTGTWAGFWASSDGVHGGDLIFTAAQAPDGWFAGVAHMADSPCFPEVDMTGDVAGGSVVAELEAPAGLVAVHATLTGSVGAQTIQGTYEVLPGGACTLDTGTWTATQQSTEFAGPVPQAAALPPSGPAAWILDEDGALVGTVDRSGVLTLRYPGGLPPDALGAPLCDDRLRAAP